MAVKSYKDTKVYKLDFEQAMDVHKTSKTFSKEEMYSLTDQIRRSSRGACANLAEAYRKKRNTPHFIAKASDCDTENSETNIWIEFSLACKYISIEKYGLLVSRNEEIGKLLNHMMNNPEKY